MRTYRVPPQLAAVKDWPRLALYYKYHVGKIAADRRVSMARMRSFCKHTLPSQLTPKQWLRQMRLAQAERLLCDGFSTKAVAHELGYEDAPHFCHEFKRERGRAPQAWLALVRKWEDEPVRFTAVELPKLPPEPKPFDETKFPWLGM